MHELSLAEAVVEICRRHAGGRRVRAVQLQVGHLRQVVPDALQFAFELLSTETELEGAELEIEEVPARGRCRACGTQTTMRQFPLQCGDCGGLDLELLAGEELSVQALEVELDEMATVTTER